MITTLRTLPRRFAAVLAVLALSLLGLAATAPGAAAEEGTGGWIRLTHLSPDTKAVDVTLTSLSSSKTWLKLDDVSYGDVSAYKRVPAGTYVAAMKPAGNSSATPMINQSVTVKDDYAYTVAAVGERADLKGKVISDDLTPPAKGTAKVRLLQASNVAPSVDVAAVQGPTLARDAAFGTTTGYAEIDPGVWTIKITPTSGGAQPAAAKVTATPGSISTVVVLDGKNGTVNAVVLKDASGTAATPKKSTGVETGGGATATDVVDTAGPGRGLAATFALVGVAAMVGVVRRRTRVGSR